MFRCERVRKLLGGYLYGELSSRERSQMEAHLQTCANCRAEVAASEKLLARIPKDLMQIAEEDAPRILGAVAGKLASYRLRRSGEKRFFPVLRLAFMGAIFLTIGLLVGQRLPRPETGKVVVMRIPVPQTTPPETQQPIIVESAPVAIAEPREKHSVQRNRLVPTTQRKVAPTREPSTEVLPPEPEVPTLVEVVTSLEAPRPLGLDDVMHISSARPDSTFEES